MQAGKILRTDPEVLHEQDTNGNTLLHLAALRRSPELCKLFIGIDSDLVKTANNRGFLPFYCSCNHCNTETAKYLYHLYPESIKIPNNNNDVFYPLHCLLICIHVHDITELAEFSIEYEIGALSVPTRNSGSGNLPLHLACFMHGLNVVKLVYYDAYPQAIHRGNFWNYSFECGIKEA